MYYTDPISLAKGLLEIHMVQLINARFLLPLLILAIEVYVLKCKTMPLKQK